MTRILIVRLGSLGDLVHTVPAVAAIRRAHPAAEIDWLVDRSHQDFLELVSVISSVVVLKDRTVGAWLEARTTLRAREDHVAMDFQGLIKSAALARLSGATRVLGFERRALREGAAAPFYTERVPVGEGLHVIEKNLRLGAVVGGRTDVIEFPLKVTPSATVEDVTSSSDGRFALINPGAAWPNKRWPTQAFGQIARHLWERHAIGSIVLWGPGEEPLAREVVDASAGAARVAPSTSVADVLALSRAAALVISGDTGPLHLAAAAGAPVVGLFGPTDPRRNGPWRAEDISVGRYDVCACHYERQCRPGQTWCLGTIAVHDVTASIDRRLAEAG